MTFSNLGNCESAFPLFKHNISKMNSYTLIVNLEEDKNIFDGKNYYYDLDILNFGDNDAVAMPCIKVLIKVGMKYDGTPFATVRYRNVGLYSAANLKISYVFKKTTDKIQLQVYINNPITNHCYYVVKPNILKSTQQINTLLPVFKDVLTKEEYQSLDGVQEATIIKLKDYSESVITNSIAANDTSTGIKLYSDIIDGNSGTYNLGNSTNAWKSAWITHYIKFPFQSSKNIINTIQSLGKNGLGFICTNNNKLVWYKATENKWYDVMGNDITSEMNRYNS